MARHCWTIRRWRLPIVGVILAGSVILGCSDPQKRYEVLSFFFDGVPDPNAPPITNAVARIEYDEDGRPMIPIVRGTNFGVVKGSEWWLDRRQTRRFAEAVARGEFENAETAARRAFPPAGTTDLAL